MSGQLQRHALERALFEIVSRHEALRTTFKQVDGEPVQVIGPPQTLSLVSFSLESLSAAQAEAEAMMLEQREWQQSFDLERGPLFRTKLLRLAAEEHILLLTMHHIIFDAWSMGIFIRELAVLYEAYANGNPTPLAGAPVQYVDFAVAQREWLQGELLDKQSAYWKKKLRGAPSLLELPTDRPRPAAQSLRGASYPVSISADLTGALKEICGQERATLFMGLLALFKVLLYRYTNQSDIVVGVPVSGRNKPGFDEALGCFVNTLALRTELSGDLTFRELLAQVRVLTLEAFDHQDLPFEKLVEAAQAVRDISHSPLFQVMFNLQNTGAAAPQLMNLELSPFEIDNGTAKFDLTLDLTETAEGLEGLFNYNSDLFNAATIQRMTGHFEQLLAAVKANPAQRISALSLLTPAEEQLQVEWNRTEKVYPQSHCIHQIFENQVKRSPTAPALVVEGESLTYSELNARANQLAHYLRSLGVGPEVLVGLHVGRSVEMVVAVLGILKAGGAYLPLDPSYPTERLSFMLDDAQVPVLITGENVPEGLVSERVKVVVLEEELKRIEQEPDENLTGIAVVPQNLAYVIYTSGSTGRPKGVLITHRAVVNHNFGVAALYGLHPHDRVLQFASLSFDVAVEEMFPTWLRGGCVVLRPEGVLSSHTAFFEFLHKERISVVNLTTPYWNELMAEAARTGVRVNGSLRLAAVGGEIGLPEGFAFARKQVGEGVRLMNVYGPTETTVTNTVYEVNGTAAHEEAVSVPIGRPIANTQLYILDDQQRPLPVGVGGELHIGTDSIARGYLNRPEQTAEKFIPHPFSHEPGARLYKTGDVARFLSDGNVEFLGRVDHQVKVRGFRIELGEIEAVLTTHDSVREVVVIAREDTPGDKRVVAYVVPEHELTVSELRNFVLERLPDHMCPSAFVMLEAFPLTSNGKVNRRALPAPEHAPNQQSENFV
ncbi:MAG TPA: amino acid adenylation domain-containing protein, partial [Pyrinomonadaceae bacterium]|nr:amino acid adenylation domain-containing protein [Pyrinomonadaceae bacterium]